MKETIDIIFPYLYVIKDNRVFSSKDAPGRWIWCEVCLGKPGFVIEVNGIDSRNEDRVHEQLHMVALFPLLLENKMRSIPVENARPGEKAYHAIISMIGDAANNEILALMDEVSFRR